VEAPAWPDRGATEEGVDADDGARRLTRRRLVAIAALLIACAVLAVVLLDGGHSKGGTPATGVPAGDTTAAVERRTLTESSTVDGTLGYGATLELYDRLAGTFTWLPSVGATIVRGGTLFRLDNLPVVLMYGTVPAYRTLKEGISAGSDVAQLNRNLIDLGYDPEGAIAELEDFSTATAAAVRRWQKAEGLPDTGTVQLGRVVFAGGARRITAVHVALGQDPPEAQSPPPAAGAPSSPAGGKGTPGASTKPGGSKKPKQKRKAPKKPKKEKKPSPAAAKESAAHNSAGDPPAKDHSGEGSKTPAAGGAGAAAGEVVLTTTSPQQLVQLKLKAEQQQLAHLGERVPVMLPGGGTVRGTIIEVGTVASETKSPEGEKAPSGEGSGESTIPVTIALDHRVAHLDQAPVSVELVKSVRQNVLAVPATALTATAGGGYAIEVLEGSRRVELTVTPGMFANGYVQVEGAGLHEGQRVIEAE
jgi:peptidoglycan hydrolase-like protein with peptidoglycan-binding domain